MGESRGGRRRVLHRALAAMAVGDLAYRLFARERLRRALSMEPSHA